MVFYAISFTANFEENRLQRERTAWNATELREVIFRPWLSLLFWVVQIWVRWNYVANSQETTSRPIDERSEYSEWTFRWIENQNIESISVYFWQQKKNQLHGTLLFISNPHKLKINQIDSLNHFFRR